ncbi:unnamed protein product [Menidia menidia]|uniref:(Atlantic silverside) hypothetical protein n=1 Tax=Menidia menidia TaxID=238744 RepID=A0A8S4BUP2_9TELE|nr:unnamed protein product [Menidia menidia]
MDEFQNLDVKIPNCVLVEGISDEDDKEEVFDFLKQYGKITKTEIISEVDSEFEGQFVVEFSSGTAVAELRSILPYSFKSAEKSDTFFIYELAVVYAEHLARNKTHSYLLDLQKLAKHSGMDLAEVLKSTMTQIGQSVDELHSAAKMEDPDEKSEVTAATMTKEPTSSTATDPIVPRLRKQLTDVQRQLAKLTSTTTQPRITSQPKVTHSKQGVKGGNIVTSQQSPPVQVKPGYCFRCGENGHIKPQCNNEPNPALVARKRKQFAQRQQNVFQKKLN